MFGFYIKNLGMFMIGIGEDFCLRIGKARGFEILVD